MLSDYLTPLYTDSEVPKRLQYPMQYYPNDIAIEAAEDFQTFLENTPDLHDFFSKTKQGDSGGKMLGVLVVVNDQKELFYLRGFSGKLGGETDIKGFAPPIYNYTCPTNIFIPRTKVIDDLTIELNELKSIHLSPLTKERDIISQAFENQINKSHSNITENKIKRQKLRIHASDIELDELNRQSAKERKEFKTIKKAFKEATSKLDEQINTIEEEVETLVKTRKGLSRKLQEDLFIELVLENVLGEQKNVKEIFDKHTGNLPPAATGECAAPKLFQFAIQNKLKPIALAEFWWGTSSKNEVRKHKHFYPACKSKCAPILPFLLKGLEIEENPLLKEIEFTVPILLEDEHILIINKPSGMLSVEGKSELKSVQTWLQENYQIEGPGLVHRLDMATSGILMIAKSKDAHEHLQKQFLSKEIQKEYTAVLEGHVTDNSGIIDLPLRTDFEDRPRQMVCYDYGKSSQTKYEVQSRNENETIVKFQPFTGRTHQLRVHAAHIDGLNTAIKGDDLYGKPSDRLFLHASKLEFTHPVKLSKQIVYCPVNW